MNEKLQRILRLKSKAKKAWRKFYYTRVKRFWYGKVARTGWNIKRTLFWFLNPQQCFYCELPLVWDTYTVDHYIPTSKGGTNSFRNLRVCCGRCNQIKAAKMPTSGLLKHLKDVRIKHPI